MTAYKFNVQMKLVTLTVNKAGQRIKLQIPMPTGSQAIVGVDASERPAVGAMTADIRYYGVGGPGENSDAFILSLTREFMAEETDYFTVTAAVGEKVYYAQPTRLGIPQFEFTGIVGGFNDPETVQLTDPVLNITEDFYLWESANDALGTVEVYVNQP